MAVVESSKSEVERQFDHAMFQFSNAAGRETGYWANRFLQMVRRRGGVEAARASWLRPT